MKSTCLITASPKGRNGKVSIKILLLIACLFSCEKFVAIDAPQTDLIKSTVFTNDDTADAAMTDIYYRMSNSGFASGSTRSITFISSLSSDELIDYSSGGVELLTNPFNQNTLTPLNGIVGDFWGQPYAIIYRANAILEGLNAASGVSIAYKSQLEGEAKFMRAFCNFYLVNMFGDIPLVLSSNYQQNASIGRASAQDVYKQIKNDLLDAQTLLLEDYSFSKGERIRVNKGAATALLARVYLYAQEWSNAETQSSAIIANQSTYSVVSDLTTVFHKNNPEVIWQFQNTGYPQDLFTFYIFKIPPGNCALRSDFVADFEAGDQRRVAWVSSISNGVNTYFFPIKYKSFTSGVEYSTILRVGEQYLIRAEARAQQGNIGGAQADINIIRNRAALGNTPAGDKASLLLAIEEERRRELFSEWGHRWFDLKRTNRVDAIVGPLKPGWTASAALYPIPQQQIINDLAMTHAQNPGY